jgi:hypothetical protein
VNKLSQKITPIALVAILALYYFVIIEHDALGYVEKLDITRLFILPLVITTGASFYIGIIFYFKIFSDIFRIDFDRIYVYVAMIASHLGIIYTVVHFFGPERSQKYKDVIQGIFLSSVILYPYFIYLALKLLSAIRPGKIDHD